MSSRLTEHQTGLLAVLFAALLWSTGGLFIKLISLNAYTILCYRSIFSAALFVVWFRNRIWQLTPNTLLVAFLYAGLSASFVVSTKLTTAANAIFLQFTAPVYLILLEPLLFRFRQPRINIITVIVCMAGMVLFFLGDLEIGNMWGNGIALVAGMFFAAMMLAQRVNPPERHEAAIFQGNLLITLLFLPAAFRSPLPTPTEWSTLIFLGLFQLGLGYVLFTYGLKRILALETSLIAMLEPLLNPVWVLIGYGERPATTAILGGLVILSMLIIRTFALERKVHRPVT